VQNSISTPKGEWIVKGFIDIARNIYTISADTKVISKILELLLLPKIFEFANSHSLKIVLSEAQNHYPDITFVVPGNKKIAVDLKSTYRTGGNRVNGFTLGAFTGYFRQRGLKKNITFPYNEYLKHYVVGIIYSRPDTAVVQRKVYQLRQLRQITSVIRDIQFIFHEKYKIAGELTGSGNTKNIGSIKEIDRLVPGEGPFSRFRVELFDHYWMNYMTTDMARSQDLEKVPYRNLKTYFKYFNRNEADFIQSD
jgi:hypothetical protein